MRKVTIITCFSYYDSENYIFHPSHLKADLRRILSFSHNCIGCNLTDIHVLTDISPQESVQREVLNDFQSEVYRYISYKLDIQRRDYDRILSKLSNCESTPLIWLKKLCTIILSLRFKNPLCVLDRYRVTDTKLYKALLRKITPVIRNNNIVEFSNLFTSL